MPPGRTYKFSSFEGSGPRRKGSKATVAESDYVSTRQLDGRMSGLQSSRPVSPAVPRLTSMGFVKIQARGFHMRFPTLAE